MNRIEHKFSIYRVERESPACEAEPEEVQADASGSMVLKLTRWTGWCMMIAQLLLWIITNQTPLAKRSLPGGCPPGNQVLCVKAEDEDDCPWG